MRSPGVARIWHLITALVAAAALVLQTVLVFTGASVLVDGPVPPLGTRLIRLVSYFTIQSNVLVLVTVIPLVRNAVADGRLWRVLRLDAVVGIAVTGVVHWFLLRPLLHLTGASYVADKLLHVVVPILAVLGWLLFGPRPRVTLRTILYALIWPLAWLVYTMIVGAVSGWYPYPFLDVGAQGVGPVVIACLGVTVGILVVSALAWLGDRRQPGRRPEAPTAVAR